MLVCCVTLAIVTPVYSFPDLEIPPPPINTKLFIQKYQLTEEKLHCVW